MKIALFSSWLPEISEANRRMIVTLVEHLRNSDATLVTGGCGGIPALAVEVATQRGVHTVGYFPLRSKTVHLDQRHGENIDHSAFYTDTHYVEGFTARSLAMIHNVDAAIVMNGRIGTLSEFCMAVEEGLPVVVIEGTGGIADELQHIAEVSQRHFSKNQVLFETDCEKAILHLVHEHHKK